MNTSDFFQPASSKKLSETISKQFGIDVNLKKYNREQLENVRNQLRTIQFQHEQNAGINDLLTNEAYQKNQAMLQLINTRIKEMLGEDIKKLKDKMLELSEGKKGVKVAKHPRPAKGSTGSGDGNLANNYPPYDKVTRGDVVAGATGKDQKGGKAKKDESVEEGFDDMMQAVADRNSKEKKDKGTGKFNKKQTTTGTVHTRKPETFDDGGRDKDMKKAEKKVGESAKKAKNPFAAGMAAAKKEAGITKTPAKDLPKKVVKKGHEIGKSIKKSQKDESVNVFRRNVRIVNENLTRMINENEEEKAKAITAASDIVNDYTSWMQRVGQYQTKALIELADAIRSDFGAAEAETFKQTVSPALAATLETLMAQREVISNAVAVLAGEQSSAPPMGTEPAADAMEPEMGPAEPAEPDAMNEPAPDEFAGSEPASTSREMRESRFVRKLAESHSIISKLAR